MKELREAKPTIINQEPSLKDRYEYLIKARNFHYENFNKWLTYFYVANAAIFVAYYTLLSSESKSVNSTISNKLSEGEWLMLILGFIVSLFWYWSSKGYYYWNINFITLVNYYEKDIFKWKENERVYFTFANKDTQNDYTDPISGANISTSKIAILFAFTITAFWGFLLFNKIITIFDDDLSFEIFNCIFSLILSISLIQFFSDVIPEKYLFSYTTHFPNLKIVQNKWIDPDDNNNKGANAS